MLGAVTAAAAVPLGAKAADHVHAKIDAAKLSGETVTVWLLDGTTGAYLGIVLAVLLLAGVVYDALPTAKWGRTLGKKLLGLEVRDMRGARDPLLRRRPAPLAGLQRPRPAGRRDRGRRLVPVRPPVAPVLARQGRAYVRRGLTGYAGRRTGNRRPGRPLAGCVTVALRRSTRAMSSEPPPGSGQQPPEDDPFRKQPPPGTGPGTGGGTGSPYGTPPPSAGGQPPPYGSPPPPGGGGGPYNGGGGGPYRRRPPQYGGGGGPYGGGPYGGGGDPYGGGGDPYGGAPPTPSPACPRSPTAAGAPSRGSST
ncbi:hypothetical protein SFUMM280S_06757 [Streptomyces fumanus]